MKICQQCKSINGDDYKFCTSCGVKREGIELDTLVDSTKKSEKKPLTEEQKVKRRFVILLCFGAILFVAYQVNESLKPVYADSYYPRKPNSRYENAVRHVDCQKAFDAKGIKYENVKVNIKKGSKIIETMEGFQFNLDSNTFYLATYDSSGLLLSLDQNNRYGKTVYNEEGNTARFKMYGICTQAITGDKIIHLKGFKNFNN
jgi:hypothetical protein